VDQNPFSKMHRQQLAQLGREYMLAAQFNSRTGYAALRISHGDEAYKETAIDNWMAASPVYTRRMQRAMGFAGGKDVPTIFKGLQLECGLTHQYMDVHFVVEAADRGRFWLKSCGPLLETEPRGEDAVRVMCHDIEDPTFDATAVATNPRARMRPVHRPPRLPTQRGPHCEWQVFIDENAPPLPEPELAAVMDKTQLAGLVLERFTGNEPGGMDYYDGPVIEQLQLEQLSQSALGLVCRELALQGQLLTLSLAYVIAQRYGEDAAMNVAQFQMAGSTWVVSHRLKEWLGLAGDSIDDVLAVLALHPALQPAEYFNATVQRLDESRALLMFGESAALRESLPCSWFQLLRHGRVEGLNGLVQGVNACARVEAVAGGPMAFEITLDVELPAVEEPLSVQIAKGTVLYSTQLDDHIQLLNL
jgi:hypothetical protein